jgi:hypothetical protein
LVLRISKGGFLKSIVTWLLLGLLYGGFGLVAYHALARRAEAGKGMPAYSIYSREHDGLDELTRLLDKLGYETVPITRPIQQTRARGLLILVEPEGTTLLPGQPVDLPEADVRSLLKWVEEGNTLLACGRHMNSLHRQLHATIVMDDQAWEDESLQEATLGEAGRYTENLGHLIVQGNDSVEASAGLPLWWVGDRTGAVLLRHGKGRVLLVADPSLLTLPGLRRGDNVLLTVNVVTLHVQDRRVYFDEYHHGLRSGGGFWGYLRYHDDQWTLGAVLLVAAMAGWSAAVRLGKPVPRPRESRADAVDYASAVARIYQRAGASRLLAQALARDFQMFLVRHLHLKRTALSVEILAAWRSKIEDRGSKDEDRGNETSVSEPGPSILSSTTKSELDHLAQLLRGVTEVRKGNMTERRMLSWMQTFDQFRKEQSAGR